MITTEALREKLTGYPDTLFSDYAQFQQTGDPGHLHHFVIGLIQFLQDVDEGAGDPATDRFHDPDARLREDLSVDSITIAEAVFLLEDIFEVEIPTADLMQLQTIGDLKDYLGKKIIAD